MEAASARRHVDPSARTPSTADGERRARTAPLARTRPDDRHLPRVETSASAQSDGDSFWSATRLQRALEYTPARYRNSCAWGGVPRIPFPRESPTHRHDDDGPWRRRMLWFMAIAPQKSINSTSGRQLGAMTKIAVLSATANAPSLVPHVLYLGPRDALTGWLEDQGITVHFRNLSFWHELPIHLKENPTRNNFANFGAYGRLDTPFLVEELRRDGQIPPGVITDRFLYTDTDVIFLSDPVDELLSLPVPEIFSASPDVLGPGINSGIMYIYTAGLIRIRRELLDYARARRFAFGLADQTMLNKFFQLRKKTLPKLPDSLNCRLFLSCGATGGPQCSKQTSPSHGRNLSGTYYQWPSNYTPVNEPHPNTSSLAILNRFASLEHSTRSMSLYQANGAHRSRRHQSNANIPSCSHNVRIWHWHGIKPYDVRCWFNEFDRLHQTGQLSNISSVLATCDTPSPLQHPRSFNPACYLVRCARMLDLWEWWERRL